MSRRFLAVLPASARVVGTCLTLFAAMTLMGCEPGMKSDPVASPKESPAPKALSPTITANGVTLTAGEEFERIDPAKPPKQTDKALIVEVFNFKCPHCFHAHDEISEWAEKNADKIRFRAIPIYWKQQTDLPLRYYYAGHMLGKGHEMKTALFKAHFEDKMDIESASELSFVAEEVGIDPKKLANLAADKRSVEAVKKGARLSEAYGIESTPTLVVNGRYQTNLRMAGETWSDVFRVVETLMAYDKTQQ